MKNIISIDVASEVSAVCILDQNGRVVREKLVKTEISELSKIIKQIKVPKQVVFEEGTQAAWLWSELSHVCDDIFVCDPRQNVHLSGNKKSDQSDAKNLALRARGGLLTRVWHGGEELRSLRESVRMYQTLVEDCVRHKNRLRAVFRGNGLKNGKAAYQTLSRKEAVKGLPLNIQKERVERLGKVLDELEKQRALALKTMVKLARKSSMYKPLRTISGIGPVFASMFISEVGCPNRFRTRSQLWSYGGLSIATHESSEFEIRHGKISRRSRAIRTRGLTTSYNRTLKYIFKQAAMTLSRTAWKSQYLALLTRSKNANNAQLTMARKLASVMLNIAKTGEKYDIKKVFKTAS